jgi:hypothetical protein
VREEGGVLAIRVRKPAKQREEDIHMMKRLILGAAVVTVTVIAMRSAPDVVRYLKMRAM